MAATYEPIATTTVSGSSTLQITFSGISNTYTDLRLVLTAGVSGTGGIRIWLNNDNGTLQSDTHIAGDGSAAYSSRSTSATKIYIGGNWSSVPSGSNFGLYTVDIFSYAGSTNKTYLYTSSGDKNGSGETTRGVALFRSTSAITRIDLDTNATNFTAGTTATLYGILKA